jgi:hypothetical protein
MNSKMVVDGKPTSSPTCTDVKVRDFSWQAL